MSRTNTKKVKSDCQRFHPYQQNEHSHVISNHKIYHEFPSAIHWLFLLKSHSQNTVIMVILFEYMRVMGYREFEKVQQNAHCW